ncbi:MAG: Crp/Fnr family transcriptional regulator [Leadbetterella sp.]|nr:Crp/Fnr family transcriptional regulator [Leadbetterella sp.]
MSFGNRILQSMGSFSEREVAFFESKAEREVLGRNAILLKEGEVCRSFFYVLSGMAYQYSYRDIDENIVELYTEGDWCFNHSSFIRQKPSETFIKAYSDLEGVRLSLISVHELIAASPSFFQLGKLLESGVSRVRYFDEASTAVEKYNHLYGSRPDLFQKFPLKMIASYLKIAPETLSRIRSIR